MHNVPKGLRRVHGGGDWHFITCSCYRRQQFLGSAKRRDLFLKILEEVRLKYDFGRVAHAFARFWRSVGASGTYDAESRITQVDPGTPPAASYGYDANGNRVRKDAGSKYTEYIYLGGEIIAEHDQDGYWLNLA